MICRTALSTAQIRGLELLFAKRSPTGEDPDRYAIPTWLDVLRQEAGMVAEPDVTVVDAINWKERGL